MEEKKQSIAIVGFEIIEQSTSRDALNQGRFVFGQENGETLSFTQKDKSKNQIRLKL